jgi:hypothetical protein
MHIKETAQADPEYKPSDIDFQALDSNTACAGVPQATQHPECWARRPFQSRISLATSVLPTIWTGYCRGNQLYQVCWEISVST